MPEYEQCDCTQFRKALGPDLGSYEKNRRGERVHTSGRRSGAEEYCNCLHYSNQHALNGRCEAMLWDKYSVEAWEVDTHGRPVPSRTGKLACDL